MSFITEYRYTDCRTIRHSWDHIGWSEPEDDRPIAAVGANRVVTRATLCQRCGCVRTEWFAKEGKFPFRKVANRYRYPVGYRFVPDDHPGEERPTSADFNNHTIEQVFSR
jgi:hypothetical protein